MTKSIFGKFRKLEKKKKLQLVIAVSISVVLLVALPVYAWFTHKRSIALTTKINAPTQLYITAGNKESVANLEMADIDVENGSYKDFVFGIGGADVQQYQIQLAHTTNIPFEYEIYRAKSVSETEKSEAVVYVSDEENKTSLLQELYRMINCLSTLERALILLWLEEKSYQEIATILGISRNNVAVKLNRIKEKLKKMSND